MRTMNERKRKGTGGEGEGFLAPRKKKEKARHVTQKHELKHSQKHAPPAKIKTNDLRESTLTQNDVALSLAKRVISTEANGTNFVFSPLSIQALLGLTAAGSGGPTRDQLLGYLKSGSVEELNSLYSQLVKVVFDDGGPLGGPRLSFAGGVWVDRSLRLKPVFREIAKNAYKADSNHVDFQNKADAVRREVNAWANKETNGLIKDVIPSGSVDFKTRLVLANALYFKGAWTKKFDARLTKHDKFFLLNGSSVRVPFMTSTEKQFISAFDGFKALRLPYRQGEDKMRKFSMYIFLPDAKDGLPDLVEKISSKSGFIENHRPRTLVKVRDFRIPKFKFSFGFEASKTLKEQGLVLPFLGGGLTEMVDDSDVDQYLYVSSIFHKSFIEVNEEGTEAAAASVFTYKFLCNRIEKRWDFVADHPFIFVIREDMSGVVLFVGQVLNPLVG